VVASIGCNFSPDMLAAYRCQYVHVAAHCTLSVQLPQSAGPAFHGGTNFADPRFACVVDEALDAQEKRTGVEPSTDPLACREISTNFLGYILAVVST